MNETEPEPPPSDEVPPQPGDGEVWLTRAEAAARLRISERTLERYQAAGLVDPWLMPGGDRRWKPDELDALLYRRSTQTQEEA